MSGRWHFKSPKYINEGKPLDTNVNHYKNDSRDFIQPDKKLVQEHNSKKYSQYHKNSDYVMGVAIRFVDGSIFKTKDYTVNDIYEVIHKDYDKWRRALFRSRD